MAENLIIQRRRPLSARVGVLGVGHHVYWGQFEGLLETLTDKMRSFVRKLEGFHVTPVEFGIIDNAEGAYRVLPQSGGELDLLFFDMVSTPSSTFGVLRAS